jgi:carbonic anhydrase
MRQPSGLTSRQAPIQPGGALASLLRYDLPASLVVFLVALPLSLGIAVASGAPALAGLIAAIVGGVVAGALGGSPLQVSGPAAGLTVIVAGLIAEFGWAITCAITVCAGLLQIVFGLTRVGRAALAISPMVVHAMLAGIGITIALQQIHVLLGGESHSSAWHNLIHLPIHLADANPASMALVLLVIVIMVGWRWVPGAARFVPGPLVAIVVATAISLAMALNVPRVALNGSLVDALQLPSLPDGAWGAFAAGVLTVALIASVESLLTAVAVDRMQSRTRSNLDRELVGQGAANMVSGAIGGLPITGVIVRSSANVAAGARTRASSILHGVWVLVFALPFAGLVEQIPTAALAGLLVVIGVQLVKLTHIATARRNGDIAVYLVTVVGVVFLNLLEGVLLGLALSILMTTWRVSKARITSEAIGDGDWHVRVQGSCTCLSLPGLHQALSSVPAGSTVTFVMSTQFVDHAAQEYIDAWRRQHEAAGGRVYTVDSGAVDSRESDATPISGRPARIGTRSTTRNERLGISCRDRGTRPAESAASPFGETVGPSAATASSTRQRKSINDEPTPWYVHAEPA